MSANPTPPAPAAPWYTSKVQITQISTAAFALIAAFPIIGKWLGLTSLDAVTAAVSAVAAIAAIVTPVIGSFIRAKSPLQPLTLTSAGAASHPQTQAAVFAPQVMPPPHPVSGYIPIAAPVLTVDKTKPWGKSK